MASVWIETRATSDGKRHRVRFRLGGRGSRARYGGSFTTKKAATIRRNWIYGELANLRVPELSFDDAAAPTLETAAARWQESRVDVAENTRIQHRTALRKALPVLGTKRVDEITVHDVAGLVARLHGEQAKRESIRKVVNAIAMVLDHAGITPNPARDKMHVKLPRDQRPEIAPPTAEHVLAVHRLLPSRYRLPLLVLDATGMRLGELEALTWGDLDEPRGRWRVSQAVAKTGRGRWVTPPPDILEAVTGLVARDDRVPERQVFLGFGGDRFRTSIARACTAAGVPAFSPHDLRHRRISLLHLGGVPWARIGEHVGQRNLAVTANTYTHVLVDEAELDYRVLLAGHDQA